jgi:hypothetical protein
MLEDEAQRPHAVARRARLRARLGQIRVSRLARAGETSGSPGGAMRADIEAIRQAELARFQKLHPEIPAEVLDAITRSLLDKVFHAPTVRLKTLDEDLAREVARLFSN